MIKYDCRQYFIERSSIFGRNYLWNGLIVPFGPFLFFPDNFYHCTERRSLSSNNCTDHPHTLELFKIKKFYLNALVPKFLMTQKWSDLSIFPIRISSVNHESIWKEHSSLSPTSNPWVFPTIWSICIERNICSFPRGSKWNRSSSRAGKSWNRIFADKNGYLSFQSDSSSWFAVTPVYRVSCRVSRTLPSRRGDIKIDWRCINVITWSGTEL